MGEGVQPDLKLSYGRYFDNLLGQGGDRQDASEYSLEVGLLHRGAAPSAVDAARERARGNDKRWGLTLGLRGAVRKFDQGGEVPQFSGPLSESDFRLQMAARPDEVDQQLAAQSVMTPAEELQWIENGGTLRYPDGRDTMVLAGPFARLHWSPVRGRLGTVPSALRFSASAHVDYAQERFSGGNGRASGRFRNEFTEKLCDGPLAVDDDCGNLPNSGGEGDDLPDVVLDLPYARSPRVGHGIHLGLKLAAEWQIHRVTVGAWLDVANATMTTESTGGNLLNGAGMSAAFTFEEMDLFGRSVRRPRRP